MPEPVEPRDPFSKSSSEWAKADYEWLRKKKPEEIWKELREQQPDMADFIEPEPERAENSRFGEIRRLLPAGEWEFLIKKLKGIDLDGYSKDFEGKEAPSEDVFVTLASDLKEFDEARFGQEVKLSTKMQNEDFLTYLEILKQDDSTVEYFYFLYDLKCLYPDLEANTPAKIWGQLVDILEDTSANGDWVAFIELYEKAFYIDKQEIRRLLPISEVEWGKILKMVETYKGGNYRAGQISACAQAIRPQGMRDVEITADDWSGYVKTLEDKYKTEKENSWMLINIARGLKYLRIT